MRSYVAAAVVAAGLALFAQQPAAAASINYSIFANCNASCANAGMSRGSIVFGTLTLERDSIVIGGTFDETSLQDFSVTFGSSTITKAGSAGTSLVGVWGNDLTTVAALDLRAATAVAPGAGLGLVLMLGAGIVSTSANCGSAACDAVGWTDAATLSGLTLREAPGPGPGPAPVPLPPALAFAAAGAGALAFAARRKAR